MKGLNVLFGLIALAVSGYEATCCAEELMPSQKVAIFERPPSILQLEVRPDKLILIADWGDPSPYEVNVDLLVDKVNQFVQSVNGDVEKSYFTLSHRKDDKAFLVADPGIVFPIKEMKYYSPMKFSSTSYVAGEVIHVTYIDADSAENFLVDTEEFLLSLSTLKYVVPKEFLITRPHQLKNYGNSIECMFFISERPQTFNPTVSRPSLQQQNFQYGYPQQFQYVYPQQFQYVYPQSFQQGIQPRFNSRIRSQSLSTAEAESSEQNADCCH